MDVSKQPLLYMCAHGEHDGFAYEGEVGKKVMASVGIGYGMTSRFGGGEEMGAGGRVIEVGGRACKEGCAWGTESEHKGTGIEVHTKDWRPFLVLA